MKQADRTRDCVISQTIHVRMTAAKPTMVGDRDDAIDASLEIGRGLITEVMMVLQMAAEREGFKVEIELGQVTY